MVPSASLISRERRFDSAWGHAMSSSSTVERHHDTMEDVGSIPTWTTTYSTGTGVPTFLTRKSWWVRYPRRVPTRRVNP